MSDYTPLPVSLLAPGAAVGQRRHMAVRPGDDDFVEMQLRALCDHIVRDPAVVQLLGRDLDVSVLIGDHGRQLRFDLRRRPGSPKLKRQR